MKSMQKVGGIAALLQALAFVALLVLILAVLPSLGIANPDDFFDPAKAIPAVTSAPAAVLNLLQMFFSLSIVVVTLALRERLQAGAPSRMRMAVVAASIASALFLSTGILHFVGAGELGTIASRDQAAAANVYLAVNTVTDGLIAGAIFAAGWSFLLIGWAGLKGGLPKLLSYILMLGGVLAVLGFLVPPFGLFGPVVNIVWSVWLGLVLWREPASMGAPAK